MYAERIRPMVCDTVLYVNKAIAEGKKVVVEGANASMLDIDFGETPGTDPCGYGIPQCISNENTRPHGARPTFQG